MRLSVAAMLGVALSLALALPGCGGEGEATAGRAAPPARSPGAAAAPAAARLCRGQLRGFVASLDALRERLAGGLTYAQYLHRVGAARDRYDRVPSRRLAIGCLLAAGTPAERALNRYIAAANAWGDCLAVVSCETASVEPRLQREWARAADLLSTARRGLRGPGAPS